MPTKSIKDILTELMALKGENPNSLSRKSGVPQVTIFRIASGESREPRRSNVEKLAKALGENVDVFYSDSAGTVPAKQGTPTYQVEKSRAGKIAERITQLSDDSPVLDALEWLLNGAQAKASPSKARPATSVSYGPLEIKRSN